MTRTRWEMMFGQNYISSATGEGSLGQDAYCRFKIWSWLAVKVMLWQKFWYSMASSPF